MPLVQIQTIISNTTNRGGSNGRPLFIDRVGKYGIQLQPGKSYTFNGHLETTVDALYHSILQKMLDAGNVVIEHQILTPSGWCQLPDVTVLGDLTADSDTEQVISPAQVEQPATESISELEPVPEQKPTALSMEEERWKTLANLEPDTVEAIIDADVAPELKEEPGTVKADEEIASPINPNQNKGLDSKVSLSAPSPRPKGKKSTNLINVDFKSG